MEDFTNPFKFAAHSVMLAIVCTSVASAQSTVTFCGGSGEPFGEYGLANALLESPDIGGAIVIDATVDITIEHDWIGDVTAYLTHDGHSIALFDRPAFPSFPHGCGGNDIVSSFRDDAATMVGDTCSLQSPAVGGEFRPNQALSAFASSDAAGVWALTAIDWGADDCGLIPTGGVCVHLTYAADCNHNHIADTQEIASDPSLDLDDNALLDECQLHGDSDGDADIDLIDFNAYQQCAAESNFDDACWPFDFDDDNDVDLVDFAAFQAAFSG